MITTFIAALASIFFLIPGIIFQLRIERFYATRKLSAFRESVIVLCAGTLSATFVGFIIWIAGFFCTFIHSIIQRTFDSPRNFLRDDPQLAFLSFLCFFLFSCTVCFISSGRRAAGFLLKENIETRIDVNTWEYAFSKGESPSGILVRARTKDQLWVQGILEAVSDVQSDSDARNFVLVAPISVYSDKNTEDKNPDGYFDRLVVSSAEVSFVMITDTED